MCWWCCECGVCCIKFLLFIFNFAFMLGGIALIVIGTWIIIDVDDFSAFLGASTLAPPITLIVIGIVAFVISFVGCCGAIKENYDMLITFSIFLVLLLLSELAVIVAAAVNNDALKEQLRKDLEASKAKINMTDGDQKKVWTNLQKKLKCCGVDGPNDWGMIGPYPTSCCKPEYLTDEEGGVCGPWSKELLYEDGCFQRLILRIVENCIMALAVSIGIIIVEILGIVLACLLASAIGKEWDYEGYF